MSRDIRAAKPRSYSRFGLKGRQSHDDEYTQLFLFVPVKAARLEEAIRYHPTGFT